MSAVVFVGDAVSASGWRLAGVQTLVVEAGQEAACLQQAHDPSVQLLLLDAETANRIPSKLRQTLQASLSPMVLVVPDMRERVSMPDLRRYVQSQLGIGR